MKKILCAYDGTDHAKLAVREAAHLAKTNEAKLTILIVNTALGTPRARRMYHWDAAEADKIAEEARSVALGAGARRPIWLSPAPAIRPAPSSTMPTSMASTTSSRELARRVRLPSWSSARSRTPSSRRLTAR